MGGQTKSLPFSYEEIDTQLVFELFYARGEIGRHPVQSLRGGLDAAFLRDGAEHRELGEVHHSLPVNKFVNIIRFLPGTTGVIVSYLLLEPGSVSSFTSTMNARINSSILLRPDLGFATLPSGVSMPYVQRGTGDTLLLVHGSLCDFRYWEAQLGPLSARYRCIAPSLSHYWPGIDAGACDEFSWRAHVNELAEFIMALDVGSVHLLGHSRGGCIAFHLAREYPRLVRTLTLVDPGGPTSSGTSGHSALPPAINALRQKVALLIEHGAIETGLELFVDSVSAPGVWKRSSAAFRTMAIDNASTLSRQFRDPLPPYTGELAAEIKCRTLLIEGAKSPRMFRSNVDSLGRWIYQAQRRCIEGASHGMNITKPRAFNALVGSFLGG
ncbi:alpha/beta hydrolase fold [Burkholderia sp. H160]|nr:alpha/beta hydrolase fold [Burkholderia sp. H160]